MKPETRKPKKSINILPSYTSSVIKEETEFKSNLEKDNRKPNKKTQTKFIY